MNLKCAIVFNMNNLTKKIKAGLSKIHSKIVLYYIVFIITPISIMLFVFNVTIDVMKNSEVKYTLNTISQMSDSIEQSMNYIFNKAGQLSIDSTLISLLEGDGHNETDTWEKHQQIKELAGKYIGDIAYVENLFILGFDGDIYALDGSDISMPKEYSFVQSDWYTKMQTFQYTSMILPTQSVYDYMAENGEKKVITYIRRIEGQEGTLGFIMLMFEADFFETYMNGLYFKDGSSIVVVDSDTKKIVYHTDEEQISSHYHSSYLNKIFGNDTGSFVGESFEGEEEMVTFIASPETKWTIIYSIPTSVAYKAINNLISLLKYLLLLTIPTAVFLAVLVSSSLTRPILVLKESMEKVEEGDFDVVIQEDSMDEIGDLSKGFNKMVQHIKRLIGEVYQKEIHRKEAELGALQMQINPHFLYNTFQIMDIMAEEKEAYEISDACQALSAIFRYSVRKKEEVVLKEELEHVDNYIGIQKLRFGDRLDIEYDVDENTLALEVIKLIIQPLVENATVHGMERQEQMCTIKISAKLKEKDLYIEVADTGIGMDKETVQKIREEINRETTHEDAKKKVYGGIAMRNVHQRIRLRYGIQYGLEIESEKNRGTIVRIKLPVRKSRETGEMYESTDRRR